MNEIFDWILVIVSAYIALKSATRLLNYKSVSIADYIILIIFVFNCLPIFLDLVLGFPPYYLLPWYANFDVALKNNSVRFAYSFYMLVSILLLELYIQKNKHKTALVYTQNKSRIFKKEILAIAVFLPFIYIIFSGNLLNYTHYGSYSARGISSISYEIICMLELIGLFSFCSWFFVKSTKRKSILWLILYVLLITWINGKRYIIVTIIVMFLYFYLNSTFVFRRKVPIRALVLTISVSFLAFYFFYALAVKPTAQNTFESLYLNYRVDFGRDDVTKFVLYREMIEGNPILEYRGETFLSTVFMLVPRSIWEDKPYPHYRYLTAAVFDISIDKVSAGITPSLFEMSIANFGVIAGMVISNLIIIFSCYIADKSKSVPKKALYLMIIIALLTQSMDAVIVYIILLPLNAIGSRIRFRKKLML